MDVTMINEDTGKESMLSISMSDHEVIDDAVDMSVLTSFEDGNAEGEPDFVVELIDLYLDDVPQKLEAMREALTLRDAHSLRDAAHGLKGSSSSLGACQMAALCHELEASANDQSSQGLKTILIRLEHEFERVCLAFSGERQRRVAAIDG